MGLSTDDIRSLLETFEHSTWQEMTIDVGGDHLQVTRRTDGAVSTPPRSTRVAAEATSAPDRRGADVGNAVAQLPDPPLPAATVADSEQDRTRADEREAAGVPITAPSVGLFWRSPSPGAPPFVEVGSRVSPDDTIAIIEVMKLMSPLKAGVAGVVTAILAENGASVSRGDALVFVDPDS